MFWNSPLLPKMMKLSHIGIAVADLKKAEDVFRRILGDDHFHYETVADQGVRIASTEIGESRLELTEPTNPESPIAKYLAKRGEGMHHFAIEVDDIVSELARMKREGFELIDEKPRIGSHNMLIAFLHPKSTGGVLIELCQKAGEHHPPAPSSSRGGGA